MSFVEIKRRKGAAATDKPELVVSFSPRGGSKTVCAIVMRPAFIARSGFGVASYRAAIDADAKAIKVWPESGGSFKARRLKSAIVLDLGFIAAFADRAHKKLAATVALSNGFAVISLPECPADAGKAVAPSPPREPAKSPAAPTPAEEDPSPVALRAPPSPTRGEGQMAEFPDLTVNLAEGAETVTRHGEALDVSPRGARLVAALARVMPNCVGDQFLVERLWDKKPPSGAASLDMVIADLKGLKKLGLEIRTQRGIGRQLVVL